MTENEKAELSRVAATAWEASGGELSTVSEAVAAAREAQLENPDVNFQAALIRGSVVGLRHLLRAVVKHTEVATDSGSTAWLELVGTNEVVPVPLLACQNLAALLPAPRHGDELPRFLLSCTYAATAEDLEARKDGGCVHCGNQREAEIHSEHRRKLVASRYPQEQLRAGLDLFIRQVMQDEGLGGSPLEDRLLSGLSRDGAGA